MDIRGDLVEIRTVLVELGHGAYLSLVCSDRSTAWWGKECPGLDNPFSPDQGIPANGGHTTATTSTTQPGSNISRDEHGQDNTNHEQPDTPVTTRQHVPDRSSRDHFCPRHASRAAA